MVILRTVWILIKTLVTKINICIIRDTEQSTTDHNDTELENSCCNNSHHKFDNDLCLAVRNKRFIGKHGTQVNNIFSLYIYLHK